MLPHFGRFQAYADTFAIVVFADEALEFFPVIDARNMPSVGANALMLFLDFIAGGFLVVYGL